MVAAIHKKILTQQKFDEFRYDKLKVGKNQEIIDENMYFYRGVYGQLTNLNFGIKFVKFYLHQNFLVYRYSNKKIIITFLIYSRTQNYKNHSFCDRSKFTR